MNRQLERLWLLPWPPPIRRLAAKVVNNDYLQRLVVSQFRVGVVGVVRNQKGEYLLLRHTYRPEHPWGLPTGFLRPGEQPAAALTREIQEETGMRVEIGRVWRSYVELDRPLLNVVFRGEYQGGTFVASAEVADARFFPFDSLPLMMRDQLRLVADCEEAMLENVNGVGP